MNYNLKKLLKNETIPELTSLIVDELSSYGVCQYVPYQDGTYQLNLETKSELTDAQIKEVKNIVLNHNSLNFHKKQMIQKVNDLAGEVILKKYPLHKQLNMARGSKKYTATQVTEMSTWIDGILDQVTTLENLINSKLKLSTLQAIEIKIIE